MKELSGENDFDTMKENEGTRCLQSPLGYVLI
jgi:hypothetical protein